MRALGLSFNVHQQVVSAELFQRRLQHVDLLPLWLVTRPLTPRLTTQNLMEQTTKFHYSCTTSQDKPLRAT